MSPSMPSDTDIRGDSSLHEAQAEKSMANADGAAEASHAQPHVTTCHPADCEMVESPEGQELIRAAIAAMDAIL